MLKINIFKAIKECIDGSLIYHIIDFPSDILIEYLTTNPYSKGADILYFILLKKLGWNAYYNKDSVHVLSLNNELVGSYVIANQYIKAPNIINSNGSTIYELINNNIYRFISCDNYIIRYSIMNEETPYEIALKLPSVALNFSLYRNYIIKNYIIFNNSVFCIEYDFLEPLNILTYSIFKNILNRMSIVKNSMYNLWKLSLKKYYLTHLLRLNIRKFFSKLLIKDLKTLNSFFPKLVRLPKNLNSLCIKIFYMNEYTRAYILGFNIFTSDMVISLSNNNPSNNNDDENNDDENNDDENNDNNNNNDNPSNDNDDENNNNNENNDNNDDENNDDDNNDVELYNIITNIMSNYLSVENNLTLNNITEDIILKKLEYLQDVGIEKYSNKITDIKFIRDNILSGQIGTIMFEKLQGKKLLNYNDSIGTLINGYNPMDLIFIVINDMDVYILTLNEITNKIENLNLMKDNIRVIIYEKCKIMITNDVLEKLCNNIFIRLKFSNKIKPKINLANLISIY
jgi:hypothetical protein